MNISILDKTKVFQGISVILLVVVTIFLCFYNLSRHPVQRWDEQTNIDVVNETLNPPLDKGGQGGVFVLKYQNKPFFEKPPLWYWATTGIVQFTEKIPPLNLPLIKGEKSEVGNPPDKGDLGGSKVSSVLPYRLVSAVSGFLLIMLIYHIGKQFWGHWGGIVSGATMLATGHLFINNVAGYFSTHTFRSADLDTMQLLFMMLSFYFFWRVERDSHVSPLRSTILAFVFSALAVMTKGPFGILPIAVFIIYTLVNKIINIKQYQIKNLPSNISAILKWTFQTFLIPTLVLIIVILPWHIFMCLKFGQEFINEYFLYHTLQRMTETLEEHRESWNFYLRMLFDIKVFAPSILLPISIISMVWEKQRLPRRNYRSGLPGIRQFLLAMTRLGFSDFGKFGSLLGVVLPLLTFTLIQTKLAWYNLYIYPFAALCVGYLFSQVLEMRNKPLRLLSIISSSFLLLSGIIYNLMWVASL